MNSIQSQLQNLTSILTPIADQCGFALRPFSIGTAAAIDVAGVIVGTSAYNEMPRSEQTKHLYAFLAIQAAELGKLHGALQEVAALGEDDPAKRFAHFHRAFVFPFTFTVPVDALVAASAQLDSQLPAVAAASVAAIPEERAKDDGPKA